MKYACPCCGFLTYDIKPDGDYDICPVCFWEDDPVQKENPDFEGGANHVSLNQAKINFKLYGACEEKMISYVREPFEDEMPEESGDEKNDRNM